MTTKAEIDAGIDRAYEVLGCTRAHTYDEIAEAANCSRPAIIYREQMILSKLKNMGVYVSNDQEAGA